MQRLTFPLLLCGLVVLSACGPLSSSQPTPSAPSAPALSVAPSAVPRASAVKPELPAVSGTIHVWYAYGSATPEEQALRALVAGVQERFPAARIELLGMPAEQINGHLRQHPGRSGEGPDLVVGPLDGLVGSWRVGALKPLSDARPFLPSLEPAALAASSVTDQLYSLPLSLSTSVLYYNRARIAAPPATVEELLTAVRGGQQLLIPQPVEETLGWALGLGARLADTSGACVADRGVADWIALLRELRAERTVALGPSGAHGLSAFGNGSVALLIDGAEHLAEYRLALGADLGVAPVPTAGGRPSAVLRVDGIVVSAFSPNSFGAQALSMHLSSAASQRLWSTRTGRRPAATAHAIAEPALASLTAVPADALPRPMQRAPWQIYADIERLIMSPTETPDLRAQIEALCSAS